MVDLPGTILVVEDEPAIRKVIAMALGSSGHTVIDTGDGRGALEALEINKFDLVVLDVGLPDTNGFDLCQKLSSNPKYAGLAVILLTGLTSPEDVVRGLDSGAVEFISKPVDPNVLRARVAAILRFRSKKVDSQPTPAITLPEMIRERTAELAARHNLTQREREVLDLLLLGRNHDEIAIVLGFAPRTARFHVTNLLEKLEVDSRLELFRLFL